MSLGNARVPGLFFSQINCFEAMVCFQGMVGMACPLFALVEKDGSASITQVETQNLASPTMWQHQNDNIETQDFASLQI